MAQKFVINNNRLVLGHVEYHKELCKDHSATIGGGFWHIEKEKNVMVFYGASADYGPVNRLQFEAADKFPYAEKFTLFFSMHLILEAALQELGKTKIAVEHY